jgi:hypothetical protein
MSRKRRVIHYRGLIIEIIDESNTRVEVRCGTTYFNVGAPEPIGAHITLFDAHSLNPKETL